MTPSVWLRLDVWVRRTMPVALTLALLLAGAMPLPLPGVQSAAPLLSLIAIYHWGLHRPDLMPTLAAFAIGLIHDVLTGVPIGVNAAVFVLIRGVVESQRRFFTNKPFRIVWLGFALAAVVGLMSSWVLTSVFYAEWVEARALVLQALVTIACFPLASWALLRCQRAVLKQA